MFPFLQFKTEAALADQEATTLTLTNILLLKLILRPEID